MKFWKRSANRCVIYSLGRPAVVVMRFFSNDHESDEPSSVVCSPKHRWTGFALEEDAVRFAVTVFKECTG